MADNIITNNEDIAPVMMPFDSLFAAQGEKKCDLSAVDSLPLAMAYVPMQKFQKLYTAEKALEQGTLYEELYLPFTAYRVRGGV